MHSAAVATRVNDVVNKNPLLLLVLVFILPLYGKCSSIGVARLTGTRVRDTCHSEMGGLLCTYRVMVSRVHGLCRQWSPAEISGGMADLGTLLPFMVALAKEGYIRIIPVRQ